ncbi:DUF4261 domain-containing protein [Inconstantimicrobium porci]|uniref:DUF4261 domain-containing protein n=1 Tax=Inconstantimicrobium porci TaxID=2652291 RepID=UPI00240A99E6|nr:DUF4261 domain-containing protein [Inconstantimicrobium porci]MDD6771400.1 DUF4261 domain-containing protein [Inconstantimicrobium porci]
MGLMDKLKKKKVLQQDLSEKDKNPGSVFVMYLLMKDYCAMPDKGMMTEIMEKHLGEVDCFSHDKGVAGFAPKKYKVEFKEGSMPPELMVMDCIKADKLKLDDIARSQMWDCENSEEILEECKYYVVATDMMADLMENYKDRADMLMDYMEALMEMYPQCEAVLFESSKKMFTRDAIINHQIPRKDRFIYFTVNVRFFNIEGTDDMLVDSLGMSTLYLPDVQYHFHGVDPNWVVNHAYNLLSYIYDNNSPIKSGETIDGVEEGRISQDLQWKCQYEEALIQPAREVLDINMGEYAAGRRD